MSKKVNKSKVLSSLFWKLMERGGTQGVQFLVQVVLARLLAPDEYGTIAIVLVFINLAQVFVQSGLNTALIQKKQADEVDFSSVFYVSLFISLVLYGLFFLTAPYIAGFYGDPILTSVLRVLGFILFFGAFNSIQNAYISRNMMFKKLFYSSLGAVVLSGIAGIVAAYMGLGIWALVIQQLVNQASTTIIMWFTVKWRPKLMFSFVRVKTLFAFGWKLLVSSLIDVFYKDLRTLIIGKIYTSSMLGYYNRGDSFPKVIVSNINGSIQSVMLPTLSAFQDNKKRIKEMMRRAIVTSSFLIFPMMIGMAVVAEPMVKLILTDKWLSAVPFIRIFCISYTLWPIHTANLQAINAVGRSDIFLKLEITKKVVGLIILGVSLPFGVYALAFSSIISGIISAFINAYPNKRLLDYSYLEQIKDIAPSFIISIIMGAIAYLFNFLSLPAWQILMLQVIVGVIVYFGLVKILKLESFTYLLKTVKELINSKKKQATR